MAFIPVPDTAEVVMSFTGPNGNVMKNVFNVREATLVSWTPALLQGVIDLFQNWHASHARNRQSNQITLSSILARDLNVVDSYVVEESMAQVGLVASPVMPQNVTFCVKSVTGFAGRSFRGRTYWVGLAESMVSGDFVNTTDADAIVTSFFTLKSQLNTQGINPVVVSRYSNGLPRAVGVATDITNYAKTDNRVDTQRRRLLGEGQ